MRILKTPSLCQRIFPSQTWRFSPLTNNIYLSFDDGPTENVTDWVLDCLKSYGFTASFFCIGSNVAKHPELFKRITDEGHTIGNHTMNHLNAWKVEKKEYLSSVHEAAKLIPSNLFRPPYGKIKPSQQRQLSSEGFQTVMWTYLSWDFDENADMNKIFKKITRNLKGGDIVVFHDSQKASKQLQIILPLLLSWLKKSDFHVRGILESDFA